jgi:hypothetical protein
VLLPLEDTAPPNGNPLMGLAVDLQQACKCGAYVVVIGAGKGPHLASLRCEACDEHRGWLSKQTHSFISETIKQTGSATEPVKVPRRAA